MSQVAHTPCAAGTGGEHCGPARRGAFTLIELLVVVAVISILVSMTMPAVLRAMGESQKAHCKSKLSQLGHGLTAYGTSNMMLLPPFGYYRPDMSYPYQAPFWSQTLSAFLYPGLSGTEALELACRCPVWSKAGSSYGKGYTCNYGNVFRYYAPGRTGNGPLHGQGSMLRTEIRRPSGVMLLMDGDQGYCYTPMVWTRTRDLDGDGILDTHASTPIYNGGAPFRHDGACMAVFADGHVRAVRARDWLTDGNLWDPFK